MRRSIHRNGTKPPAYPFIISSCQRATGNVQRLRLYLDASRITLPGFSRCAASRSAPSAAVTGYLGAAGVTRNPKNASGDEFLRTGVRPIPQPAPVGLNMSALACSLPRFRDRLRHGPMRQHPGGSAMMVSARHGGDQQQLQHRARNPKDWSTSVSVTVQYAGSCNSSIRLATSVGWGSSPRSTILVKPKGGGF